MQNIKPFLYIGILVLALGVFLRIFSSFFILSLFFIIAGALMKITYIFAIYKRGEYKPGSELLLLGIGLSVFFTGVYFKYHFLPFHHAYLLATGGIFKMVFIFMFIQKTRKSATKVLIQP
ncbi:MAG: hypothetical protein JW717_06695 [Marinilabiliaceae bacterium]|nr:hypothetical protein [Marinilabiliaceae bacterium]